MRRLDTPTWALILAGGDGTRLQALTREIAGDARPKQFCSILDGETLLEQTRRRVDLTCRYDQQVIVVTRQHEPYYRYLAAELSPGRLVVQPENRGTGPGIVYPLIRILDLAGDVPVAIFPSDHYVVDDLAFSSYVQSAVETVGQRRDIVVLLGIEADRPETEYGWIEPSEVPLPLAGGDPTFPVRRFWEKPSAEHASALLQRGCLWNSFVMVGRVSVFLELVRATAPGLVAAFELIGRSRRGVASADVTVIERLYHRLPTVNFSEDILARGTERLVTIRVKSVHWSDWGSPHRVVASLRRAGVQPSWLDRVELASTA
jgi:mannose-1-phosphate guanylyltransferase